MEYTHKSVMVDECMQALNIRRDGVYVDGTLGRAGHSREIAKRLITGRPPHLHRPGFRRH